MKPASLFKEEAQRAMLQLWHDAYIGHKKEPSLREALTCMRTNNNYLKGYPTLARELNPDDDGAKLGALTLFMLMLTTGDHSPLEDWAEKLGYRLVRAEEDSIVPIERRALIELAERVLCKNCPAYSRCVLKDGDIATYNVHDCVAEILQAVGGA